MHSLTLEKLAAESKKKKKSLTEKAIPAAGAVFVAANVKSVADTLVGGPLTRIAINDKSRKAKLNSYDIKKLRKILGVDKRVRVINKPHMIFAHYDPVRMRVVAPKSHGAVLAHELGHAGSKGGKIFATPFGAGFSRVLMGAGAATGAGMLIAGDTDSKVLKYAPLVPAIAATPVLLEEGRASITGLGAMKKLKKLSPEAMKAARSSLLKAFATYAALPVGATLGLMAGVRVKKNMEVDISNKKKNKEKKK